MLILTTRGELDEVALLKTDTLVDNDHERTITVEYCLVDCGGPAHQTGIPDAASHFCDQHVHRSVHVTIKEWPMAGAASGTFT